MKSKNFLVFDLGSSNGRAFVVKFYGNKFTMEQTHRFDNRPVYASGTYYWDILRLYSEIKNGIQVTNKIFKDIVSMAVDTWAVDFGFIDKEGKLISNPVHHRDLKRNLAQKDLYEIIPEKEIFKLTGGMLNSAFSIFHMFSLKKQNATELGMADKFLMIPDIFCYFLTGEIYNEFTNVTTTTFYNQADKKWSKQILDTIGIPESIFPEIVQPGKILGNISNDICLELEISKKFPLIVSPYDSAAAEAAIPILEKNKTTAYSTSGTWFNIGTETKDVIINDKVFDYGYSNLGGVSGTNHLTRNMTGLWVVQQCRQKWIQEAGKDISWSEIDGIFPKAKSFKSFIDIDNPIFGKMQHDMPRVINDYCIQTNQKPLEGIGEISRCIYESIVLKLKYNFQMMEKIIGKKIELIHFVGGGTSCRVLCQWIADATNVNVIAGPTECTSIGNFLVQLMAMGEIKNLREGRELVYKSSDITIYEPDNKCCWDLVYDRFLKTLLTAKDIIQA